MLVLFNFFNFFFQTKGEMTPFGTLLQFDQEVITSKEKKSSYSGKKSNNSTDFDSFLMGLDNKLTRKPVKKRLEPQKKNSADKPTTSRAAENNHNLAQNTDFDNFLNGLDTNSKASKTKKFLSATTPITNSSTTTSSTKSNKSQSDISSKSVLTKKNSDPLKVCYFLMLY